uniref:Uncharacterized protein n=1 Tax=Zonotrichia albicollis TaxID=44394 RepID=A0A8D2MCW4_ZONAL
MPGQRHNSLPPVPDLGGDPPSVAVRSKLNSPCSSRGCCSTSSRSLLPLWKPLRSRAKWRLGLSR